MPDETDTKPRAKMPKVLTEHDVDLAIEKASVERQQNRLKFARGVVIILVVGWCVNTCLASPPTLPEDPSVTCASRGYVWHPEVPGFWAHERVDGYCSAPTPCSEKK
jgi:hypothetical protein